MLMAKRLPESPRHRLQSKPRSKKIIRFARWKAHHLLNSPTSTVRLWHLTTFLLSWFLVHQTDALSILSHVAEPSLVSNCTNATLKCQIELPAPGVEVWWTFRGENASKLPNVVFNSNNSAMGIWELELLCPTLDHAGAYACNAQSKNDSELVYRKEVILDVHVPVRIEVGENVTAVDPGQRVNLTCLVTSYPLATVHWEKDGQEIKPPATNLNLAQSRAGNSSNVTSLTDNAFSTTTTTLSPRTDEESTVSATSPPVTTTGSPPTTSGNLEAEEEGLPSETTTGLASSPEEEEFIPEIGTPAALTSAAETGVKEIENNDSVDISTQVVNSLRIETITVSDVSLVTSLIIEGVLGSDNGTYKCVGSHDYSMNPSYAVQELLVLEPPEVSLDSVEAQDSRTAFLRWRIRHQGTLPLKRFHLQVKNFSSGADWLDVDDKIPPNVTTYTIRYLAPAVTYSFQLAAISDAGQGRWETMNLTMPADVPPRVSSVHVLAYTNETLLFAWLRPENDNGANITHFTVQLSKDGQIIENKTMESPSSTRSKHMYLFTYLIPGKQYAFKVQACNVIGCGNWSDSSEASTADGIPDPPENVELKCYYDPARNIHHIVVHWDIPKSPRGTIQNYNVSVEGQAQYLNKDSNKITEHFFDSHVVHKDNLTYKGTIKPNTHYVVRICTINKSGCGPMSNITTNSMCSSPPAVPTDLPKLRLRKSDDEEDCQLLTLKMERISQRNGEIMCYHVVIIKLQKGMDLQNLPINPMSLNLSTYHDVHQDGAHGAYIAESFDNDNFIEEVRIGDENYHLCHVHQPLTVLQRFKRSNLILENNITEPESIYDGKLSPNTNYTGFVEVHVIGPNGTILSKPSSYFAPALTGSLPTPVATDGSTTLILGIICGIVMVSLVLVLVLCLASRRKNGHPFEEDGGHMGLTAIIRRTIHRNGHVPRGKGNNVSKSPRLGPIAAEDLPNAFVERHLDSDLLFQCEFEALPTSFKDRSTLASDSPENLCKNRYPDIKAYDQTRVRLAPIDDVPGSDYINANFVLGYKGRKTFICAQGPLDRTVTDFWRMIWEHKVTVVVMLTGIEEHGKVKCAPYWSDDGPKDIEKLFTVSVLSTKMYSDYIVRRLQVQQTKDGLTEERELLHFHFVMWKDFLAPDQPSWILKFIKRVNEHYSPDRGPLLTHCSAGVGRTGTLVAIDILLQQLEEENVVDIYSCVCNLRRQRNYLVQSQKQYIFVYRALMEHAQFGDTEVEIRHLRDHFEQLKQKVGDTNRTGLELEYEKLCYVIEDPKTFCVGTMDINKGKNRYDTIIPYDLNRVILPPSPSRDHSSYINASFIQGYDRSLSVVITQDPMPNTLNEFWRMVKEQSITTLVMLSDIGEGQCKCPKYWPDLGEEIEFDYVKVKMVAGSEDEVSQTIKRKFIVTNTKNNDEHTLTHFQFCGWTNLVPESTSSILELIESVQENQTRGPNSGPITVHCSGGGDRSSVFVTLSVLIQQLKAEERVDLFQAARYTRSQRHAMLQTLAQYHFLYRGLLDYITERKLCDMGDTQL